MKTAFSAVLLQALLFSQHYPITIDGLFSDWEDVPVAAADIFADVHDWDMEVLKATHDSTYLFMYFYFSDNEHLLQDWNDIHLFLDLDNDSSTGGSVHGIGADIVWCFGCRAGRYVSVSGLETIWQDDLHLRMMPTITDTQFEIALGLESNALTLWNTITPDTIQIVFYSDSLGSDDQMPESGGSVEYVIGNTTVAPPQPMSLEKESEEHIRLVSYNVLTSNIVDNDYIEYFERILTAIDPDIIVLQEFYYTSDTTQLKSLISSWLPGVTWHMSGLFRDNIIVSKYPVLDAAFVTASTRTMAALLDTEDELGKKLMIFSSHLSCCANNDSRQYDADEFVSFMRDWIQNGNGPFTLEDETPFMHVGDINLVGYRRQLTTLTEGDIEDESTFGSDFPLDWDTTAIADLFSRHTHERMGYTWRRDYSSFSPGKLDYILYTDSVIDTGKHFVLNTLSMSAADLATYGLEQNDTYDASDHLPRVLDIASVHSLSTEPETLIPSAFILYPPYPNPFNPVTTIRFNIPVGARHASPLQLYIYDITGKLVETLTIENKIGGLQEIQWHASGFASGVYFAELVSGNNRQAQKLILLK